MTPPLRLALVGLASMFCIGYFGTYSYYRFYDDGGVLDHIGAFGHGNRTFTFSEHSRSLGDICLGDSFSGESVVSRLSATTGTSFAPITNKLFAPLARLDYLFTGHWITFSDQVAQPVFHSIQPVSTDVEIKLTDAKLVEFEGFINYRP